MKDLQKIAENYHRQFKSYNKACSYMINRGFIDKRSRENIVRNHLIGISMEDKSDYYYGYLVFPIFLNHKTIISFTSRSILDGVKPIHKHWPGIIDCFYNHQIIESYDSIIITESPLDALSLRNIGRAAVATMGSSKLPRLNSDLTGKDVTIIFDTDLNNSGQSKAKLLASRLYTVCRSIRIGQISLPIGQKKIDINDLFKQLKNEDFRDYIHNIIVEATEYIYVESVKKQYISEHDFSEYDIVDIVSEHVSLDKIGNLYRTYCPFHNDSDPSFTVYPDTGSFYCFGCEKGGDAINFLQEIMGFECMEAKKYWEVNYVYLYRNCNHNRPVHPGTIICSCLCCNSSVGNRYNQT